MKMKATGFPIGRIATIVIGIEVLCGAGRAIAQRPLGVDVSSYQGGSYDWVTAKSQGIVFAWAKATEGTYDNDADFVVNENNGKNAGVYIGAYDFCRPDLYNPGTEAAFFWNGAGGYILADGKTLMPMLDFETFNGHPSTTTYSEWANDWCTEIVQDAANNGVAIRPFIYSSACTFDNLDSSVSQWVSDIANYNGESAQTGTPWNVCASQDPWGSSIWHVWQYADNGNYGGQSVDSDVFNGTLATLQSTLLATASASSKIFYWDPQGTTGANPYTGSMSGSWENNSWAFGSTGLASPVGWLDGKATVFGVHTGSGTPAYTVTMNSSHVVAGFFDGALTPKACDVTIQGAGVIDLASGPQALDVKNGSDGSSAFLRINVNIAGDGQLFPEGNGQAYLHGINTYSGGTQLGYDDVNGSNPFSGTVNFNNGSAFGTGTITLWTYGTGSALVLEGTSAVTVPNSVTVASATTNNIVGNAAGLTFSGNWTLGGNLLTLGTGSTAGNQTIISGVVSGTAGLTVYNSGTLVLSGVNTYSGTTTITSPAVVIIGGAGQLGSGSYSGNIANTGTFRYSSTAAQTLSGVISGSGALNENGSGTLKLSAANSYTGATAINGGSLQLGVNNGVPTGSSVFVANGATFDMNGLSDSIATLGGTVGAAQPAGNVINNNGTLTINGTTVLNSGQAGSGAYSGVISGSGKVVVSGGGSTTFSGANTYAGTTTVSGGTLVPSYNGALPPGSAIAVNSPGILDIVSVNETIPSLSGSGAVNLESGTLTVGGGNVSSIFSGVIRNSPATYNNGASVNGLQGFYFPAINFTGTPVIRVDSTVNFSDFTQASQNPLYPTTNEISVRWIGQVLTTGTGGAYTFTTTSDDGSRCWVNGVLVVDNWAFQGATARSGTITLSANAMYDIRVEYMQGTGGGSCVLSWTPPGGSSAAIPNANLFTYAGAGGLVKIGTGTLALSGANTYAGNTTISAGTLALGSAGSINNTALVGLAAGATLDVSAISSYNLGSSTTLSASGTSTPATIKGGTTVSLGSRPIILTYDGSHPALTISQGNLSLNGNAFTVNNASGTPLGFGSYLLVQQAAGNITSVGSYSVGVTGSGLVAGTTASIQVSGGMVNLVVQGTTPSFSNLSASQSTTYGSTGVTLGGTLSAPGPLYPANGATITVSINGNSQTTTINDNTGDFSISYNPSTIPANGTAYAITYSYGGAGPLNSATDSSTALTVNTAALGITANNDSKTYGQTKTYGPGSIAFGSSGLKNGQTIGAVTITASGGTAATDGIGAYSLVPSTATGGTFNAANYNITYNSGTLTVNPLVVNLTGTRPYDGTNDAAASILSVANKVGSDAVTVASGSAVLASASVGPEAVTSIGTLALGGTAATNYTLIGATGSVTITSSGFLITAESVDSTGTNFVITWQSVPGTTYQVLGNTSAGAALNTWTNVGGPVIATDTNTSVTNAISSPMNVFTVKSQ